MVRSSILPIKHPKGLKPYSDNGMDLSFSPGDKEAKAECPICGSDKFSINAETSKAKCWSCNQDEIKNGMTFVRWLWNKSDETTDVKDYDQLARDRGLLFKDTLMAFGVCRSYFLKDCWLVPGYNEVGVIQQLYRYTRPRLGARPTLLSTGGLEHRLFGIPVYNKDAEKVYICEGPWDAMVLYELLSNHGEYKKTSTVLGVPGCNVFKEDWRSLLYNKDVVVMFDNDHPKVQKDGKKSVPAALVGLRKLAELLLSGNRQPLSISYLRWNPSRKPVEVVYDKDLASGYDIRDYLTKGE